VTATLVIARLTVAEAVRRRIVWILFGLTVISVVLTTSGVGWLVSLAREREQNQLAISIAVAEILVLVAFMFSFVLAMTAAFLAAPAIATDLETGVAQAILARPIRRTDLVVGRWLGLGIVGLVYAVASGLLEIVAFRLVSNYLPPKPLEAGLYLAAQAIVLLTIALLLSTRLPAMASGAICVVLFGLGWMSGVLADVGRALDATPLVTVAEASRWLLPTDGLWRGAINALQPPVGVLLGEGSDTIAARAGPFFAPTPPPVEFLVWAAVWTLLVLGLASWSLERRDL
jgi:ABC-type transport system involved in multi-copper enzyme maturation permease subunit